MTLTAPIRTETATSTGQLAFQPFNRVAGNVSLHVTADRSSGRYRDARCGVHTFRGYENILAGRDVRDAIFIASRCCGYHGGQHSIAAAQAVEMALGMAPPAMGVAVRNMGLACETVHAEAAHLFLLAGPDFSEQSVRAHWPDLWAAAERAPAPHADTHNVRTIGDIMRSLNPLTGFWYKDAFRVARIPYQMYAVMHGKYPHPETIVPGGVASNITHTTTSKLHDYAVRLLSLVDPAKQVVTMLDDLFDFTLATVPEIAQVGVRPANLIDSGGYDDPEFDDPSYEGLTRRGERRWGAPGAILDGRLVTSDLREIAEGLEEGVEHSFYESWGGGAHPASKRTSVIKARAGFDGRYSYSTTVRWRGNIVETGPGARLWATALRGRMPEINPFLAAENGAVQMCLPGAVGSIRGLLPEMVLEWRPPTVWNAVERNRARLYGIVFAALVAANSALKVFDLQKDSRYETSLGTDFPRPRRQSYGVGFSGDGLLGHWITVDRGLIGNYQVIGPSTINMGPGGPVEEAVNDTPILDAEGAGADALVAARSLDPCGNCASH